MTYQLTPDELVDFCRATGCSMSLARSFIAEMDPKLRSRVLLAVKSNIPEDELLQDPIELDEIFKKLIEEAAVKAKKNVTYKGRGVCHMLWEEQKNILKDEHGIDWYSPAEMNPWVEFD
jgi:hypothetical protein